MLVAIGPGGQTATCTDCARNCYARLSGPEAAASHPAGPAIGVTTEDDERADSRGAAPAPAGAALRRAGGVAGRAAEVGDRPGRPEPRGGAGRGGRDGEDGPRRAGTGCTE